jgi:hypothetical protein
VGSEPHKVPSPVSTACIPNGQPEIAGESFCQGMYRAFHSGYNRPHQITVHVAGGEYILDQTVTFTSDDSGWAGHPITYQAWNPGGIGGISDDDPLFSGGVRILQWEVEQVLGADCNNNILKIWKATVPAGIPEPRDIYLNARRLVPARYPNIPRRASPTTGRTHTCRRVRMRVCLWSRTWSGHLPTREPDIAGSDLFYAGP